MGESKKYGERKRKHPLTFGMCPGEKGDVLTELGTLSSGIGKASSVGLSLSNCNISPVWKPQYESKLLQVALAFELGFRAGRSQVLGF